MMTKLVLYIFYRKILRKRILINTEFNKSSQLNIEFICMILYTLVSLIILIKLILMGVTFVINLVPISFFGIEQYKLIFTLILYSQLVLHSHNNYFIALLDYLLFLIMIL